MTRHQQYVRRLASSEAGFTIMEMLVATALMMVVTASVFDLMNPAQGTFQTQPEVADMQQRLRVGVDSVAKDLVMAGAGAYMGTSTGALYNYFAPILPYSSGSDPAFHDPGQGNYYFPDKISIIYVPPTPAQTTIRDAMPASSSELKVQAELNCPGGKQNALCGFSDNMRVVVFDSNGSFDPLTITQVQDAALHLQHNRDKLSVSYQAGAQVTQVATHTYYLDSTTKQLMHYDGYQTALPVADNVVGLEFAYFGDPQPPMRIPNKPITDPKGPWTTYGPKPPAVGVPNSAGGWPNGENCTFLVDGATGDHAPRLEILGGGGIGMVPLDPAILQDGPWCPNATVSDRFDADLLRVRRVRVKMRMQVGDSKFRGVDALLWKNPGTSIGSNRIVPDQELSFDVAPRNMNLGR
jgi:Tfp pilus assembly protein PilW